MPDDRRDPPAFAATDLTAVAATGDGVAWSASPPGLHVNLVVLGPGGVIAEHVNTEVEVVVVVLDGEASVTVDGVAHHWRVGSAGVIGRGSRRGIRAGAGGARYLSVHNARAPLGVRGPQSGAP